MGPPSKTVFTKAAFDCCLKTGPGRPGIISYWDWIMGFMAKSDVEWTGWVTGYQGWTGKLFLMGRGGARPKIYAAGENQQGKSLW